ncbi:methyltransferase [uncultured Draconibacterium sp.]|uniref:methyltransferase family protein n=1 Tax=uncultured Draconibacterium sp. TaxID=1573823 RepID=UPI00321689A4
MNLFIFYCVFLITIFVIPSYTNYKRTGVNPFQFSKEETAINYVGKAYKLISFMAFVTVLINAFIPEVMNYFNTVEYLQTNILYWLGFSLLYFSFIWIYIAQRNMDDEWRIGIDNKNKVKLITKGLFRISRNPIFFGIILMFVGLFLIIPNTITAIILFTGIIVIQIQVRLEEEFLLKELGEEYWNYRKKVKRWLF